jgi:uncharacterized protein (TIGR04168 family)
MPQREFNQEIDASKKSIKIAIIGDVHNAWDADDELALRALAVDLVLFVGDFGNEAVDIVQQIAAVSLAKAVILGNHDAWYSATDWGRQKCPYDRAQEDRVQQQLDLLGDAHVGYGKLDFPDLGVSVVGARPFSWGGSAWKNTEFYKDRYGVHNLAESTDKIVAAAKQATCRSIVFLGHCGPLGLGDRPEDICGKDWHPIGGDHGDPDFAAAIAQTRALGKIIPLVAFGHMHHQLRHTKQRDRTAVVTDTAGTLHVNAAYVPRIIRQGQYSRRNFTIVTLRAGKVVKVSLLWLDQDFAVVAEEIFYSVDCLKSFA